MKKYFISLSVMALFAIGFTASEEESNSSSGSSSSTQTEQVEQKKEKVEEKLISPGNSYISNKFKAPFALGLRQYEVNMYNDGTFDIKETIYLDGEENVIESEGKWEKKTESRKDIVRTWYKFKGYEYYFLVNEDGKIFYISGSNSEHEAVGKNCVGTFRKK